MNCMKYDHNQFVGLFEFQSGCRKFYLNSLKVINAQTVLKIVSRRPTHGGGPRQKDPFGLVA